MHLARVEVYKYIINTEKEQAPVHLLFVSDSHQPRCFPSCPHIGSIIQVIAWLLSCLGRRSEYLVVPAMDSLRESVTSCLPKYIAPQYTLIFQDLSSMEVSSTPLAFILLALLKYRQDHLVSLLFLITAQLRCLNYKLLEDREIFLCLP